ncbi:MAG: tetratricopeptide repeat protein [Spirochaetes bacterium]|jgi:tetratricopeptide (TPR) repeat protein|nr:tetratricopeptide repeat protein [Spirochaetota bacterium]
MKKIFLLILLVSSFQLTASDYSTGVRLFMRKDPDKAREHFLAAIESDPTNGNAYYYLGEIEKNKRNYPSAIEYYIQALDNRLSNKYQKLTYWNLVILAEQLNDMGGMVKACRIMYEKRGDNTAKNKVDDLINKMLWTSNETAIKAYDSGKANIAGGNIENAVSDFNSALSHDRSFLAPRFEIGMIHYKNGDISKALTNLRYIADKIPYYTAAQTLVAKLSMDQKDYHAAIKYYTNILEYGFINSTIRFNTLSQRSTCYFMTNRYSNAESDIEQALKIRNSDNLKKILSATYIKQNRFDEALEILTKLNKKSPKNDDIKYQIGSLYYKKNDEKWIKTFGALFNLTHNSKKLSEKYRKAYLLLANHYFDEKQYDHSTRIYKTIPAESFNFNEKKTAAYSFYFSAQYKNAIDLLETISLTDSDKVMLARAYTKTGFEAKARSTIEHMVLHTSSRETLLNDADLGSLAHKIVADYEAEKAKAEEERIAKEKALEKEREESKKKAASTTEPDPAG